jgi:hypothetical protein
MRFDDATLIERARLDGRTYTARLRPSVPRGSQMRAELTLPQARPCYVGAFSNVLTID